MKGSLGHGEGASRRLLGERVKDLPRISASRCQASRVARLRGTFPAVSGAPGPSYGRPAAMNSAALGHIRCNAQSQQSGRRA